MEKKLVGSVKHYFGKAGVAVVELSDELKIGDHIVLEGAESFEQVVDSMQIERKNIPVAKKGQAIGLKTVQPVREGYLVYKKLG